MPVWCIDGQFADMSGKGLKRYPNRAARPWPGSQTPQETPVSDDINVLALVKGEERYIFLYDDGHKSDALKTLGRFASNPELSFSWYDAAVLSQRIRQTALEQRAETEVEAEAVAEEAAVPSRRHNRFKLPLAE